MQNKPSTPAAQRVSNLVSVGLFSTEKKRVSATALHLPANGHTDKDGAPVPDPQVFEYVKSKLIRPIFDVLAEYKEIAGVPTPMCSLPFLNLTLAAIRLPMPKNMPT